MDNRKVLLCPAGCGECPEVEFAGDQVRIVSLFMDTSSELIHSLLPVFSFQCSVRP